MIRTNTTWRRRLAMALMAVTIAVTGSVLGSNRASAAGAILTATDVELGVPTELTVSGCQPYIDGAVVVAITDSAGKEVERFNMTETTAGWNATAAGEYTATVTCKRSGGTPDDTASAKFKVTAVPITVVPATWEAGTQVTLSASGYQPNEPVYVYMIGCPTGFKCPTEMIYREYGEVSADASGKFTLATQVPASLPAGQWRFEVSTVASSLRRWSPTMTTTATPTAIDVFPATWGADSRVTIWSSGFAPMETATVKVVATPNCKAGSTCSEVKDAVATFVTTADYTGRIATSFTVPADLAPGQWAIIASGPTSGTKRASVVVDTAADVIQTTPVKWKAGDKVGLKARGYNPGETVTVEVWGLNLCAAGDFGAPGDTECPKSGSWKQWTTTADSEGAIAFTADVPANLFGTSYFTAVGKDSGTDRKSAQIQLSQPSLTTTPAAWKAGSSVTLTGTAFVAGESVTLKLVGVKACGKEANCPQTTIKTWTTTAAADKYGNWTYQVQVPKDLPAGTWAFVALGATSGAERVTGSVIIANKLPTTGD